MKKAFTLIELLVVLAIIGILAAMIIASLSGARARARDAQRKSDLRQIKTALEQYYQDNNQTYPLAAAWEADLTAGTPSYMRAVPQDPSSAGSYTYSVDATQTNYAVQADLENNNEAITAGVVAGAGGGNGVYEPAAGDKWFQVSND